VTTVTATIAMNELSVVLIGSDGEGRKALAEAFAGHGVAISGELGAYPNLHHLDKLIGVDCDVVVVDLDLDPDVALDLVENICGRSSGITVMVYSRSRDPEMLMRCMRAGAREFLAQPIVPEALAEALIRASARRLDLDRQKQVAGKVLVFRGAKGGSGVTTLAGNFSIALKQQSGQEVALVDLNPELGDVAVALGLTPQFSVSDALRNPERLDQEFLSTLLVEHKSGVRVLAACDQYHPGPLAQNGSLGKLLYVLRHKFPYVVVDAGPGLGPAAEAVFEMADRVYLVTEADIASLRNAERLLAYMRRPAAAEHRVEVVLNRWDHRKMEVPEDRIAKALGAPVRWKVPNDYASVQRSLNAGTPLALGNSAVSRAVHQMAREVCGKPAAAEKKGKWDLF
jgi:pilus assembly protein CpaE